MQWRQFLRPFVAKCDCCKRVTAIVGKFEVSSGAAIAGELQMCSNCYPLIGAADPQTAAPEDNESMTADIDDMELETLLASGRRLM